MIHLNSRDPRPIYEQIMDNLRRLIISGGVAPGDRLPSVREMAAQLAINPNTIQRAYRELENEGYLIDRVSLNFSMQELHLDSFCEDVIQIIEKNGVAFEKIAIELTETKNEKDFLMMQEVIERLQAMNIKFYLDDFGTGYSNFERIIELPIDIIKFDRSLTILASKDDESKFMVGSFSEIFKKADYQILFEGVEDERDESQCIDMNAMYLQGYKYSKPIPIEKLRDFLDKER